MSSMNTITIEIQSGDFVQVTGTRGGQPVTYVSVVWEATSDEYGLYLGTVRLGPVDEDGRAEVWQDQASTANDVITVVQGPVPDVDPDSYADAVRDIVEAVAGQRARYAARESAAAEREALRNPAPMPMHRAHDLDAYAGDYRPMCGASEFNRVSRFRHHVTCAECLATYPDGCTCGFLDCRCAASAPAPVALTATDTPTESMQAALTEASWQAFARAYTGSPITARGAWCREVGLRATPAV
jgi:hypothetical protein